MVQLSRRKYNLEISNVTKPHLDGSAGSREFKLINGQYPGPTIRAKWGDTIIVNVKNNMQDNGTGIHWHGVRQLNSCQQDGVPGITECPIAPGKTRQYKFKATQFGTTWYHSHWSVQYGDGALGTMIIDGPATANYDEDLGVLPITDYYYTPAFTLFELAQRVRGGPPIPSNILVNGTHVNASGGGKYAKMTVTKGKKYRIRIINTSVDSTFSVSLDGHPFTVMTADFVPVKSFITTQLTLAIGQRYDVVINANQTVDNYWFRVAVGTDCGSNAMIASGVQMGAIVSYSGASGGNPTSTGVAMRTACVDEKTSDLVPFVPNIVPSSVIGSTGKLEVGFNRTAPENLARWLIDGIPMVVDWNNPTLETTLAGSNKFPTNANIRELSTSNWYLWWIQSTAALQLPHPIHLHGHDFYIVGEGNGTWDGSTTGLTLNNPTRRDTKSMPVGGYLLLAFPADNPGAWVMHCHIAWHASEGLAMQFLERKGKIQSTIGSTSEFKRGCDEWDGYWFDGNHPYNQTESGI
ncbi:laccase, multicopper oxidase, benzenediol:oxygen oxidorectuctase [Ascochyta clinopodiicola]|nr:laccase, multicopper oxidase, benzenediol:oxygen oxidorectuctase [Ascochyta clinopodiicola]